VREDRAEREVDRVTGADDGVVEAEALRSPGAVALRQRRQHEALHREVGRHEPRRRHEHDRERKPELPRGVGAAEVDLVADERVRPPRGAAGGDAGRSLALHDTAVVLPQHPLLAIAVDGHERPALGRPELAGRRRDRGEPAPLDERHHPRGARERHGVAGRGGRAGDRHERLEVAGAAREREEDPHDSAR
jgi:hypothetical protein